MWGTSSSEDVSNGSRALRSAPKSPSADAAQQSDQQPAGFAADVLDSLQHEADSSTGDYTRGFQTDFPDYPSSSPATGASTGPSTAAATASPSAPSKQPDNGDADSSDTAAESKDTTDSGDSTEVEKLELRKALTPLSREQLVELLVELGVKDDHVARAIRARSQNEPNSAKLFVRELAWQTTSKTLREAFEPYGEVVQATVVLDRRTHRSRGFGFVTFKTVEAAKKALKEPYKRIDNRMTQANAYGFGRKHETHGGDESIVSFLQRMKLEDFIPVFRKNAIDNDTFLLLSEAHLKEMGVPLGSRMKLLREIDFRRHRSSQGNAANHGPPGAGRGYRRGRGYGGRGMHMSHARMYGRPMRGGRGNSMPQRRGYMHSPNAPQPQPRTGYMSPSPQGPPQGMSTVDAGRNHGSGSTSQGNAMGHPQQPSDHSLSQHMQQTALQHPHAATAHVLAPMQAMPPMGVHMPNMSHMTISNQFQ